MERAFSMINPGDIMTRDSKIDKSKRIWEIDFVRGFMLVVMIVLHTLYDLENFYNKPINYSDTALMLIKLGPAIFILVSGISINFSRSSFKRGIIVLAGALAVTLFSYIFSPDYLIVFGILHFFGTCMIISPLLKKIPTAFLFILSFIIASTIFIIPYIKIDNSYLFMLGIYNESFESADYFPLFPWSCFFVFGMAIGRILYKEKKSIFKFTIAKNPINFLGRHSLLIYLVHQPVIMGVLALVMRFF